MGEGSAWVPLYPVTLPLGDGGLCVGSVQIEAGQVARA